MNDTDLFPDCRQDSPRLAWMKRHGIETQELKRKKLIRVVKVDKGFVTICCYSPECMEIEDMLTDFAKRIGIPLWNEEQFLNKKDNK